MVGLDGMNAGFGHLKHFDGDPNYPDVYSVGTLTMIYDPFSPPGPSVVGVAPSEGWVYGGGVVSPLKSDLYKKVPVDCVNQVTACSSTAGGALPGESCAGGEVDSGASTSN